MEVLLLIDFSAFTETSVYRFYWKVPQALPLCSSVNSSREYDECEEFMERY